MQAMRQLRFATFLSPLLYGTYEYIARYVGEHIGYPARLTVGQSFEELAEGLVDISFLCGLPYVRMRRQASCPIELLAAPVLEGKRYQGKPMYFSDVIVLQKSPYRCLDDLRGCTWAYNERASHSGCNLVCYSLLTRGKPPHYFGRTISSGSHQRSLQMVLEGQADATAIDSHLLDVLLARDAGLAARLRIIDSLGPSTIPPIAVSKSLNSELKCRIQAVLLAMHTDPEAASKLQEGLIERFVPIADEQYDDIREMLVQVEKMEFPFM